jgi:hypothetical protein
MLAGQSQNPPRGPDLGCWAAIAGRRAPAAPPGTFSSWQWRRRHNALLLRQCGFLCSEAMRLFVQKLLEPRAFAGCYARGWLSLHCQRRCVMCSERLPALPAVMCDVLRAAACIASPPRTEDILGLSVYWVVLVDTK